MRPALMLMLLLAAAGARSEDLRGLISACADGDMQLCRQIDQVGADAGIGSSALDTLASQFAGAVATDVTLVHDGTPDLAAVYPRVIDAYFAAPELADARGSWSRPQRIPACAEHYADTWLYERSWWPTDREGRPDWRLIYFHVLDHYFGLCVK
ncbi:MAG: hypothetical protein IT495_13195 [Gammaproteobacteria bacterium]|nr:hypothetical protein [Gammaproteobacteria bacterium]